VEQPAPALIEAVAVSKRFGDSVVLDRIDLALPRGETFVVIGGSGSGKSTLARILVGLERPTTGQVLLDGLDLARLHGRALAAQRDRMAMVFQRHALLDSLSVFDNVAFALREAKHELEVETRDRVMALLEELGIADAAEKLPAAISGGMAKRVAIARALVVDPEIVVYDEPTTGLDPPTARGVDLLIDRMRSERGVTSIVITHDMATAFGVADRVAVLDRGRFAWSGIPEEMEASPAPATLVEASGVDLDLLRVRRERPSADEVRARWHRTHVEAPRRPAEHRFWHLVESARHLVDPEFRHDEQR
jgi:phospholipid/cholesterol/gamma-HCH transport system ATP-binding protein